MHIKKTALLFFVLALVLSACKKEKNPPVKQYKVKYTLGCTDCTIIYYYDENGNDTTEYHKNSNWSYTFNGKPGQQLILFAYNTSGAAQTVSTAISLNDTLLATQTGYCPINGSSFCSDTIP